MEVMRSVPRGHESTGAVRERDFFCRSSKELHICEAFVISSRTTLLEHLGRNIDANDPDHMRRERERRAARPGSNIQGHVMDARFSERAEHGEARPGMMHCTGGIPLCMRIELCLTRRHSGRVENVPVESMPSRVGAGADCWRCGHRGWR